MRKAATIARRAPTNDSKRLIPAIGRTTSVMNRPQPTIRAAMANVRKGSSSEGPIIAIVSERKPAVRIKAKSSQVGPLPREIAMSTAATSHPT
jgi:hypothetical protein